MESETRGKQTSPMNFKPQRSNELHTGVSWEAKRTQVKTNHSDIVNSRQTYNDNNINNTDV